MATRMTPMNELYEEDFYAWAKAQADLLRARRLSDLDLEHLIEEIDDLAEARYRSARAHVRRIVERLLQLEHSPARDQRGSWAETVRTQRSDLHDQLSASLRPKIEQALARIYDRARRNAEAALQERGEHAAAAALPETCPYTLDQITGDWLP